MDLNFTPWLAVDVTIYLHSNVKAAYEILYAKKIDIHVFATANQLPSNHRNEFNRYK